MLTVKRNPPSRSTLIDSRSKQDSKVRRCQGESYSRLADWYRDAARPCLLSNDCSYSPSALWRWREVQRTEDSHCQYDTSAASIYLDWRSHQIGNATSNGHQLLATPRQLKLFKPDSVLLSIMP